MKTITEVVVLAFAAVGAITIINRAWDHTEAALKRSRARREAACPDWLAQTLATVAPRPSRRVRTSQLHPYAAELADIPVEQITRMYPNPGQENPS